MNEVIQLAEMSLETLTALAKESFEDCAEPLRLILENEQRLNRFAEILRACKAKVPHGKWQQWVEETFAGQVSLRAVQLWIAEAGEPEKKQKRLEAAKAQQQKVRAKAQNFALLPEEPKPVAVGTIRHESPPTPQPQPERPAWLADPDELERPEETDLPPLPKTNTHHTAANRREPDARETDRIGLVSPEDPRTLQDGRLYIWRESANRLFAATPDEIWEAAMEAIPEKLAAHSQAPNTEPCDTKKVVDRDRDTTAVVQAKPGKVPTVTQLTEMLVQRSAPGNWPLTAVEMIGRWAAHKQSLTGRAKIRTEQQWETALSRMENVAAVHGWPVVADMIEKAIANGWQGWEHTTDSGRKPAPVAPHRTYTRLSKPEIKYDELPE